MPAPVFISRAAAERLSGLNAMALPRPIYPAFVQLVPGEF